MTVLHFIVESVIEGKGFAERNTLQDILKHLIADTGAVELFLGEFTVIV